MRSYPHKSVSPRNRQEGFTLIEVLVVISIIGILLGVSASMLTPSDARNTSIAREVVVGHLSQARSHAISTRKPTAVVIAPSDPALGEQSGRIIGVVEVSKTDNSTTLLSRWEELPKSQIFMPQGLIGLTRATILEDDGRLTVSYRSDGRETEVEMPYVLFGSEGAVLYPVGKKVEIAVGPGITDKDGQLRLVGSRREKEMVEILQISPLSGKPRIISPSQK